MSWKTLLIENENNFRIKNNQLIVNIKDNKISYELDKIDSIIVDNTQTTFTTPSLLSVSENNIPLIINDKTHSPKAIVLPLTGSVNVLKNLLLQINQVQRSKDNAWNKIIQSQIENQINFLREFNVNEETIKEFELLRKRVVRGDEHNIEAICSKKYFAKMFGVDFIRVKQNPINSAYNYGSKIIAAKISSVLISHGLNPILGIHHKGQMNSFNLAYDFIEPFRPLIIYIVAKNRKYIDFELNLTIRKILVNILNYPVKINNKYIRVKHAINWMIKSYISYLENSAIDFYLPFIVPKDLEIEELSDNE